MTPLSLAQARSTLSLEEFRTRLRSILLKNPSLTLQQVATRLGTSRQRVAQLVGPLNRPNISSPLFMRLSPKAEQARLKLDELKQHVARGESAERAAQKLGISLVQAYKLGFRARDIKPAHGDGRKDCFCWRCKKAQGLVTPRGPKIGIQMRMKVEDLLAWTDPDDGSRLTQQVIARLAGCGQGAVSRIANAGN